MTLLGMMPELKLVNMTFDDGVAKIGLTEFGNRFALLQNPIIDLERPQPLSDDEIWFLLNHIADNLPAESEHIIVALDTIKNGKRTRDELNATLKEYYLHYHRGTEWSDTVVNTMRSGLLSRLNELGLVKREKNGKHVLFHITDEGEKYLKNISKKDELGKEHQGRSEFAA